MTLDAAATISSRDIPGFWLYPLKGKYKGRESIWGNGSRGAGQCSRKGHGEPRCQALAAARQSSPYHP